MSALLLFYGGTHPDHRGRMLAEILRQDDDWLEATHDVIQWLFPLAEPSRASRHAPLLDAATVHAFRSDEVLRQHMRAALVRMLAFFGLCIRRDGIVKAEHWHLRKPVWFTCSTHNSLRLTRMLKCLYALGFEWEARTLQTCLEALCETEPGCGIDAASRQFWQHAVPALPAKPGGGGDGPGPRKLRPEVDSS